MHIQAIRNDVIYRATLARVSALVDLDPHADSPEGEELDVLATLVEAYEARHHPVPPPDPVSAIRFHMDNTGMGVAELVPYIGARNRVYEVLNGTRPLSIHMIQRLLSLGIPAASLIQPEPVEA